MIVGVLILVSLDSPWISSDCVLCIKINYSPIFSQIIGKSSVESGDSDPAYSPGRDSDFSDFPAESEGGSSDDSRPSSPSTSTEKKPTFPVKKKSKLEISQVGIRPPLRPANLRKTSNTPVSSVNRKGKQGNEKLTH